MEGIIHAVIYAILCAVILYQWLISHKPSEYEKFLLNSEIFKRDYDITELKQAKDFLIKERQKLILEISQLNKQLEAAMCDYEKEADRNYVYKELADFEAFVEKQEKIAGQGNDMDYVDGCKFTIGLIRRYIHEKNQAPEDVCTWTYDWDLDCYNTSCGNSWTLNDGTPAENGMGFCPYCGLKLEEKIVEVQE